MTDIMHAKYYTTVASLFKTSRR